MKKLLYFVFIFSTLFLFGCNGGLSPEPEGQSQQQEAGFGGSVAFLGKWPTGVTRTHIVAFRSPLLTAGDFNALNLAFVSDSIPYGVSGIVFSSLINPGLPIKAGQYAYVAVAMSKSPTLSLVRKDWFVAGVYYANGDTTKPGKLTIPENTFVGNINITCDFNHPPLQPPGGE
ncbi:MAG TPA: hypothetical protein VHO03_15015 [Ignavibacteriales bacterium]|nr:hypothetical protein [Ignavibacteriales bacterium]